MIKKAGLKKKKKETVENPLPHSKRPSNRKDGVLPEAQETHTRAEWQKEKRVYWSSRFRRVLEDIMTKPKPKKTNSL